MSKAAKKQVAQLLDLAGITINGKREFDITVHDERLYHRVLAQRELGLGEAYMDGWWDVGRLDLFISKIFQADLRSKLKVTPGLFKEIVVSAIKNRQTTTAAKRNAIHHYDIGNDLYERMLDKRMIYTCGYWKNAKTLDEAQEAKLRLICRKLHLKPGMQLLDIGCGWGGFAKFAAQEYGVEVTAITPAAEQVKLAKENTKGLKVTILQQDYREVTGKFDRITSIGMMEHVGPKNYKTFFDVCNKLLNNDGIMLHHTVGNNKSTHYTDPWVDKYIFPGAVVPSLAQISKATERTLIIEDVQNIGPDYYKTLLAWYKNFTSRYPEIKDKYGERFYRMWTYYLLIFAGSFHARELQLYQIVFTKVRPSETYQSVR